MVDKNSEEIPLYDKCKECTRRDGDKGYVLYRLFAPSYKYGCATVGCETPDFKEFSPHVDKKKEIDLKKLMERLISSSNEERKNILYEILKIAGFNF